MKTNFKYSNVLAIVAIILTIVIYFISDKKKELTLSTNSFISLVDKNSLSGSGITVSFDSVPVTNLYKVNFSITNTGNVAILESDLIDKLKIKFDTKATLLRYDLIAKPHTIKVNDKIVNNEIVISPDLLNPNDRINFIAYYTLNKSGALPSSNSRIVDGKVIILDKSFEASRENKFIVTINPIFENICFWYMFIWSILILILIFWAIFIQKSSRSNGLFANTIGFILLGGGSILTILYALSRDIL